MYLWKSINVSLASLDFMLLLELQTSMVLFTWRGKKNQWVSTNKLSPVFRKGKKRRVPIKNKQNPTNKQRNLPSATIGSLRLDMVEMCWWQQSDLVKLGASGMCSIPVCMFVRNLQVAKFTESHGQPPLDEGGIDFLLFLFHEALHVCGRQEIRHILIGNYIRKLND